jgi:hypothetical protein
MALTLELIVVNCVNCIGFEVLTAVVRKTSVIWDIQPCGLLKFNRYLALLPHLLSKLASCPAYFSTMKMKAIFSSEMLADSQWTTGR